MQNWFIEYLSVAMNILTVVVLGIIGILAARAHQSKAELNRGQHLAKPKPDKTPETVSKSIPSYLWVLLAVCVVLTLTFQLIAAFNHHTYDTESIKYYRDKFDNDRLIQWREEAARVLFTYLTGTNKDWNTFTNGIGALDQVLGFWDDLGYDEQHGKICAEVVHQQLILWRPYPVLAIQRTIHCLLSKDGQ
jgi:formate hydrogenlyase subunit 3/multisubunit Na+/H+ antiporter MnhD subunit